MITKPRLAAGTVHAIPADLRIAIFASDAAHVAWNDITPLARNEWICLVISAKLDGTRDRRIKRAIDQLSSGKRRPCCWAGCIHRQK